MNKNHIDDSNTTWDQKSILKNPVLLEFNKQNLKYFSLLIEKHKKRD